MRAVDCQGFGGAFALGAVQAGFDFIAKLEGEGGFGMPVVAANPVLYGRPWMHAGEPGSWPAIECELLAGNPPCSGFSLLNKSSGANTRGAGAPVNQCMRDFFAYAAACRPPGAGLGSVHIGRAARRGRGA